MMAAFLQDAALFISLIIAVVVGLILWRIPIKQLPSWAQTKDGKGVIKGVILAPLVIVIFAVLYGFGIGSLVYWVMEFLHWCFKKWKQHREKKKAAVKEDTEE